jgi:hypothetical protein
MEYMILMRMPAKHSFNDISAATTARLYGKKEQKNCSAKKHKCEFFQ